MKGDLPLFFSNDDLQQIVTPINVGKLEELLIQSEYDSEKSKFLIQGFSQGFNIGYRGPLNRQSKSDNIPLSIGNKIDLWNKIMKEINLKRFAGPFDEIPYEFFIQSPIGLVPKAGDQMRLIFHLSYDFGKLECEKSVNYHTPDELCSIRYNDLDHAITNSLHILEEFGHQTTIYYGKTDVRSAFRVAPLKLSNFVFSL